MKSKPAAVLGKVAWIIAILLLAVVAVGVQMDRQARRSASIARLVPKPFQAYALETLAREAYQAGQNSQGLAYSRALVERRPVPAESLSLLTNGLLLSGQDSAALPVLLLAAQRGWRDRYTQQVMVAAAMQAEDTNVAAQRLLALWREGDRSALTKDLTVQVLTNPDGLAAFARGIGRTEQAWGSDFMRWGGDQLPVSSVSAVAASMGRNKVEVDCASLSNRARQLVRFGNSEAGTVIWKEMCANGEVTPAGNFAFTPISMAGPFDWQFPEQAGLDTELLAGPRGTVLHYTNSDPVRAVVTKRYSVLRPGNHVARIEMERGAGRSDDRALLLQILCFSRDGAYRDVSRIQLDGKGTGFEIPAEGCLSQELSLIASRGEGRIMSLTIEP